MIWMLLPPALWVFYLAYQSLLIHWRILAPEVKLLGLFVVAVGLALDIAFNWTFGLLLGVTKDATFSQKCSRLKRVGGWRSRVANYLCERWLDPFQLGGHCRG